MKAYPFSLVVIFLMLLGHEMGFLGWEMGDVSVPRNTEQCGQAFVVWPVIEIVMLVPTLHCMGTLRVCHFKHDLSLKHNHTMHPRAHSFFSSMRSTPAADGSL
jgi:hypothetical protein